MWRKSATSYNKMILVCCVKSSKRAFAVTSESHTVVDMFEHVGDDELENLKIEYLMEEKIFGSFSVFYSSQDYITTATFFGRYDLAWEEIGDMLENTTDDRLSLYKIGAWTLETIRRHMRFTSRDNVSPRTMFLSGKFISDIYVATRDSAIAGTMMMKGIPSNYKPTRVQSRNKLCPSIMRVMQLLMVKGLYEVSSALFKYMSYVFEGQDMLKQEIVHECVRHLQERFPHELQLSFNYIMTGLFHHEMNGKFENCIVHRMMLLSFPKHLDQYTLPIAINDAQVYACNRGQRRAIKSQRSFSDSLIYTPEEYIHIITKGKVTSSYLKENGMILYGSSLSGLVLDNTADVYRGNLGMIVCTDSRIRVHKLSAGLFNEKWSQYDKGSVRCTDVEKGSCTVSYDNRKIDITPSIDSATRYLAKNANSCDRIYYDGENLFMFPSFLYYSITGINLQMVIPEYIKNNCDPKQLSEYLKSTCYTCKASEVEYLSRYGVHCSPMSTAFDSINEDSKRLIDPIDRENSEVTMPDVSRVKY